MIIHKEKIKMKIKKTKNDFIDSMLRDNYIFRNFLSGFCESYLFGSGFGEFYDNYISPKIPEDIKELMNWLASYSHERVRRKPKYIEPSVIKELFNNLFNILTEDLHNAYYEKSSLDRSDISRRIVDTDKTIYESLYHIVNHINIYYPGYIVNNFDKDLFLRDYSDHYDGLKRLKYQREEKYIETICGYNRINRFTGEDDLELLYGAIDEVGKINKDFPLSVSVESDEDVDVDRVLENPTPQRIITAGDATLYKDSEIRCWYQGYGYDRKKDADNRLDYDLILVKYREYFLDGRNNLSDELYYWIENKVIPSLYTKNISIKDLYEAYKFVYRTKKESIPLLEGPGSGLLDTGENILNLYYENIDEMMDLVFGKNTTLMGTPTGIIKTLISSRDQKE